MEGAAEASRARNNCWITPASPRRRNSWDNAANDSVEPTQRGTAAGAEGRKQQPCPGGGRGQQERAHGRARKPSNAVGGIAREHST